MPTQNALSSPERETFTAENILDFITAVTPAALTTVAIDLQYLVEHDEEHRSASYWLGKALQSGAAAQRRSMENTFATRSAKANAKEAEKAMAAFTNTLAMNPKIVADCKKGNPGLLWKTAGAFKIPADIVLNLIEQLQEPEQAAEPVAASAAA